MAPEATIILARQRGEISLRELLNAPPAVVMGPIWYPIAAIIACFMVVQRRRLFCFAKAAASTIGFGGWGAVRAGTRTRRRRSAGSPYTVHLNPKPSPVPMTADLEAGLSPGYMPVLRMGEADQSRLTHRSTASGGGGVVREYASPARLDMVQSLLWTRTRGLSVPVPPLTPFFDGPHTSPLRDSLTNSLTTSASLDARDNGRGTGAEEFLKAKTSPAPLLRTSSESPEVRACGSPQSILARSSRGASPRRGMRQRRDAAAQPRPPPPLMLEEDTSDDALDEAPGAPSEQVSDEDPEQLREALGEDLSFMDSLGRNVSLSPMRRRLESRGRDKHFIYATEDEGDGDFDNRSTADSDVLLGLDLSIPSSTGSDSVRDPDEDDGFDVYSDGGGTPRLFSPAAALQTPGAYAAAAAAAAGNVFAYPSPALETEKRHPVMGRLMQLDLSQPRVSDSLLRQVSMSSNGSSEFSGMSSRGEGSGRRRASSSGSRRRGSFWEPPSTPMPLPRPSSFQMSPLSCDADDMDDAFVREKFASPRRASYPFGGKELPV